MHAFKQFNVMPNFKLRPFDLLLIVAILVIVAGLPLFGSSIDVYLFDTYFVPSMKFLTWILFFSMVIPWLIYSLTKHFSLLKFLVWIHVFLSIICAIFILVIPYFFQFSDVGVAGAPRRYIDYDSFSDYQTLGNMAPAIKIMVVLELIAQSVFIVNIIIGVVTFLSAKKKLQDKSVEEL